MSEQSFGKYQLLKRIATGGMAEVWLARQTGIEGFQRDLVVKRILPHLADDPEFVQMFLNEARIAARFNHPNIAQIYDLGETNGQYYIAMEFVHGEDLGRLMRKAWSTGQWLAQPLAIRIVAACCEGLYYAHSRTDENGRPLRVVHRDISPQNILISFDGSVKLVDFGIAKAADQASLTKSGAIKGKFAYMSPEQASGRPLDQRSDLFAIGLVLYELLTGTRPLKRETEIATLQAALACEIEPPSVVADVPPELDPVVMQALAKAPDDRYRDARHFQLALEELLVSQGWVASSVQVSELMTTLFRERLEEEARLGYPNPGRSDSQVSASNRPEPPPRTDSGKRVATEEMSWEAPSRVPDAPAERRARNQARADPLTDPAVPVVGPRDAPPGAASGPETPARRRTEAPSRRLSNPNQMAVARHPSRGDVPRHGGEPPVSRRSEETRIMPMEDLEDERDEDPEERELTPPPRRATSAGLRASERHAPPRRASDTNIVRVDGPKRDERREPPEEEEETLPRPAVPTRRSRTQVPAQKPRTSARMPAVRRDPAPGPDAPVPQDRTDPIVGVERRRASARRWPLWVLYVCLGLVALMAAFVFKQFLDEWRAHSGSSGQAVALRVGSNLPIRVLVRHHPDEGRGRGGVEEELAPLAGAELIHGAHLRDTVILENQTEGARYEKELKLGQPGGTHEIRKEFEKGFVELESLGDKQLENLPIYMNGSERGRYRPGLRIELYEGKHLLELRDELGRVVGRPFAVEVKPNATTEVRVDVARTGGAASKGGP